jgi:5-methylcytosine-specific restriction protein A
MKRCPTLKRPKVCTPSIGDPSRGTSTARGFTWRWRQLSLRYRANHPLCERCLAAGRTVPATEVHHKLKHGGDPSLVMDSDQLEALCHACHSSATARGE